jgi:hypothetical protein
MTDGKKSALTGKAKGRFLDVAKAYRIKDPAAFLQGVALPKRSRLFVVPETAAADAELRRGWPVGREGLRSRAVVGVKTKRAVAAQAYEPSARAKAILRGITYAEEDLKAAGGTYDIDDVRTLFRGISRQAVDKKVAEGSLLAVPGPSGRRRFPAAQFTDDGSVVKGLKEVQSALGLSSQWSVLNFLVNEHDLLGNETPIDALRRGDVARVVEAAKRSGVHGG